MMINNVDVHIWDPRLLSGEHAVSHNETLVYLYPE